MNSAFLRGFDLLGDDRLQAIHNALDHILTAPPVRPTPGHREDATNRYHPAGIESLTGREGDVRKIAQKPIERQNFAEFALVKLLTDLKLAKISVVTDDRLSLPKPHATARASVDPTVSPAPVYLGRPPDPKATSSSSADPTRSDKAKAETLGTLLSQWTLGDDPNAYVWPGKTCHVGGTQTAAPDTQEQQQQQQQQQSSIDARNTQFDRPPSPEPLSSQPMINSQLDMPPSSQAGPMDNFASTQTVPGKFGGRVNAPSFRKTFGKKRRVGF